MEPLIVRSWASSRETIELAVLFPRSLPLWVTRDTRRAAEIKVFNKCKDELDDDWFIFYSRPWWGLNSTGGEKDGEADFILVHPNLGILFLEVKGGQIAYSSEDAKWSSVDRHGVRHNIKNPMQQAVTCRHQLLEKFKTNKEWPRGRVIAHYGVVFTDTIDPKMEFIGGYESDLFCHSQEFENDFVNWIETRLTAHVGESEIGPGLSGIKCIEKTISAPIEMRTTLSRRFESELDEMNDYLTGVQAMTVFGLEQENRAVIEGGAGTGKTVIACELAARAATSGSKTLLTCKSLTLVEELRIRTKDISPHILKILTIEDSLALEESFDLIVVDEGQDIEWDRWPLLERKLVSRQSKLFCFMDSNQAIYRIATDLVSRLSAKHVTLRVNLRNTQNIAKLTNKLYEGPLPTVVGPEGQITQFTFEDDFSKLIQKISTEVKFLVEKENLRESDIGIISDDLNLLRKIEQSLKSNSILTTKCISRQFNAVTIDSIRNFKGLEAKHVILIVNNEAGNSRELSYVGVSRARNSLHIYSNSKRFKLINALNEINKT